MYCADEGGFEEDWFKCLFGRKNILICGDFNARSVLWGSSEGDSRDWMIGKIL